MKNLLILISICALSACAPKALDLGAEQVEVSTERQPKGCKLVGQVIGSEGNFVSGQFTSNENLELGALNDMRNRAYKLGANHIKIISNRASQSGALSGGSGHISQVTVTYVGTAYKCP